MYNVILRPTVKAATLDSPINGILVTNMPD